MLKNVQELEKNHDFLTVFLFAFCEKYNVFQPSFDDISASFWRILTQNSALERLLAVDYMFEIRMRNFKNFM
jgi:hypothetical protein